MTKRLFTTALFAVLANVLLAQGFSGIFQATEAEMRYTDTEGWEAFLDDHEAQVTDGFRLIDLESNRVGGDARHYYGIYTQSSLVDSVGMALGFQRFATCCNLKVWSSRVTMHTRRMVARMRPCLITSTSPEINM